MGGWRPPSFAHDGLRRPAPLHAVSDECLRSAAFHGSAVRRTTAASPRGRAASPRPAPRAHGVVRELIRTPAAAEGRGQAQTGAHFRHSESAARPRRGRSSSGSAPSAGEADASSRATRGRAGGRSCGAAPGADPAILERLGNRQLPCNTSSESRGENLGVRGGIAKQAPTARARRGYVAHLLVGYRLESCMGGHG